MDVATTVAGNSGAPERHGNKGTEDKTAFRTSFPELAQLLPETDSGSFKAPTLSNETAAALTDILVRNMDKIDNTTSFALFAQLCLNVDPRIIAGPNDPTKDIINGVVGRATAGFWAASSDASNAKYLGSLLGRCRNLISVFSRHEKFDLVSSILEVLVRVNLTKELVHTYNLFSAVETAASKTSDIHVTNLAARAISVFEKLGCTSNVSQKKTAKPTQKLFGDSGALKIHSVKRTREQQQQDNDNDDMQPGKNSPDLSSPPKFDSAPEFEQQTIHDDIESQLPRKKAKSTKRVHWKPDSDLVQVKFFTMEGTPKYKSRNMRLSEVKEAPQFVPKPEIHSIEWRIPPPAELPNINPQLLSVMSSKRGGTLGSVSDDAKVQADREAKVPRVVYSEALGNPIPPSPKEPTNPYDSTGDKVWTPRTGGHFEAAKPSELWLKKNSAKQLPSMPNGIMPGMNPMMGMPPPIPSFNWNGVMPMNPMQMNEFYKMNPMFSKQNQ